MNQKILKLFETYKKILIKRLKKHKRPGNLRAGNKKKRSILRFYMANNRWPSRRSKNKNEKTLAISLENYVSKKAAAYDPQLRRIAMVTGRKTNNKREHNVQGFKQEILEFIKQNGRIPNRYQYEKIPGEGNLNSKLEDYVKRRNDMTFLGEIYALDKCHKTGIPFKFRPLINASLVVDSPLVRMPNYELEQK